MSPRGHNNPDYVIFSWVAVALQGNAMQSGLGKPCETANDISHAISPCLVSFILLVEGKAGLTREGPECGFMKEKVLQLDEFGRGCALRCFMAGTVHRGL